MTELFQWVVRFRTCDIIWADAHADLGSYTGIWDAIPWYTELTEAWHTDESSARNQYNTLVNWEKLRLQPVKDVTLGRVVSQSIEDRVL